MTHRRGGDLSGGQQRQLAIACAFAAGPKVLIIDEPTEGIHPSIIEDIGRVTRMLADKGMNGAATGGRKMAFVLVEQFHDLTAELADQYSVMERGEIIRRGRGADIEADGVREPMSI
jgi:urea transport system ATP-binding protein